MTLKAGDKCLVFPEGVCVECKAVGVGDTVVVIPTGGGPVAKRLHGKVGNGVYALPTASGVVAVQGRDSLDNVYLTSIDDYTGSYVINPSNFLGNDMGTYSTISEYGYIIANWDSYVDFDEVTSVKFYFTTPDELAHGAYRYVNLSPLDHIGPDNEHIISYSYYSTDVLLHVYFFSPNQICVVNWGDTIYAYKSEVIE